MRIGFWGTGIALALAYGTVSPAHAEFLVTRSSGEIAREYPQGLRIPVETVLDLVAGDRITLLTNAGTQRFAGPGRFVVADLPSLADNFFWLLGRQTETPRVAVARMEIGPPPPDILRPFAYLWRVDLNQSSDICYAFEGLLETQLRAYQFEDLQTVTFTRLRDGTRSIFRYDADMGSLVNDRGWLQGWPVDLDIASGDRFRIEFATDPASPRAEPVILNFHQLDIDPFEGIDPSLERPAFIRQVIEKLSGIEAALEARGCTDQLAATRNTLERYREELANPDYWGPAIPEPPIPQPENEPFSK
ncbi:MAG: hypothetical protein ACTS1Z_04715 [Parasphingopyxis sp.]|uniref:hypothetical protein n=1 Tax=Parasphingopyxis sp. TaxID=1920299 RepID=UPI003F9F609A